MARHAYLKLTHLEASVLLELLESVDCDTVLPDGFTLATSGRTRAFNSLKGKANYACEGACINRKPPADFPVEPEKEGNDESSNG